MNNTKKGKRRISDSPKEGNQASSQVHALPKRAKTKACDKMELEPMRRSIRVKKPVTDLYVVALETDAVQLKQKQKVRNLKQKEQKILENALTGELPIVSGLKTFVISFEGEFAHIPGKSDLSIFGMQFCRISDGTNTCIIGKSMTKDDNQSETITRSELMSNANMILCIRRILQSILLTGDDINASFVHIEARNIIVNLNQNEINTSLFFKSLKNKSQTGSNTIIVKNYDFKLATPYTNTPRNRTMQQIQDFKTDDQLNVWPEYIGQKLLQRTIILYKGNEITLENYLQRKQYVDVYKTTNEENKVEFVYIPKYKEIFNQQEQIITEIGLDYFEAIRTVIVMLNEYEKIYNSLTGLSESLNTLCVKDKSSNPTQRGGKAKWQKKTKSAPKESKTKTPANKSDTSKATAKKATLGNKNNIKAKSNKP